MFEQVLSSAGTSVLDTSSLGTLEPRLQSVTASIEKLQSVSTDDRAAVERFTEAYRKLRENWLAFYQSVQAAQRAEGQAASHKAALAAHARSGSREPPPPPPTPAAPLPALPNTDDVFAQLSALRANERERVQRATDAFFETVRVTDRAALGAFSLAVLVALGVAGQVIWSLNRRLDQLKTGAARIGGGDFEHRLPASNDELGRVANAFNVMSYSLKLAHTREADARTELEQRHQQLQVSQQRLATELAEAAAYVQSLLPPPMNGPIRADGRFIPSEQLGGDSYGYHWIDGDHLAIYLLDVCGHGVGAALLSVSAVNVLRSGSLPGRDMRSPGQVLTGLNELFQMDRHNDAYFTIWYGVFDTATRRLSYAGGGHPPALLMHDHGRHEVLRLTGEGLMIGALPGLEYHQQEIHLPGPARLYVFSDGIYEVHTRDGQLLGLDDFATVLSVVPSNHGSALEQVLAEVRALVGASGFVDDVSVMEVRIGAA